MSLEMLLESHEFSEKPILDVASWNYSDLVCSALAYVYSNIEPSVYSWSVITEILTNDFLTDDFLLFLKKNSFYSLASREDIIKGISFSFRYLRHSFSSAKSIRNAFDFIEMEKSEIDKIIEAFLVRKDFIIITNFFFFATKKE